MRRAALVLVGLVLLSYTLGLLIRNQALSHTYYYVRYDTVGYGTFLIQLEDSNALSRDVIFGNRVYVNAAHPIFVRLLQLASHLLGSDDFGEANLLLQVILLAVYLPGMFSFLYVVLRNWPVALLLAVLSSGVSVLYIHSRLTVTGTFWYLGVPATRLGASSLYTAITPWLGVLLVLWMFRPGWQGKSIAPWRMVLLGLLLGMSILVHAINDLALIEAVVVIGLVQVARGKLPMSRLVLFAGAALLPVALRMFGGAGVAGDLPFEGAQATIQLGQSYTMVYPWKLNKIADALVVIILIYAAVSIGLLWSVRRTRPGRLRRLLVTLLVSLQILLTWLVLWTNLLLMLLVGGYTLYRARRGDASQMESWLGLSLVVMLISGPIQQTAFYLVWRSLHLTSLTGLLYEMARFAHNAYLPFFALGGFALLAVLRGLIVRFPVLGTWRVAPIVSAALVIVLWLDLGGALCLLLLAAVGLLALVVYRWGGQDLVRPQPQAIGVTAGVTAGVLLVLLLVNPDYSPKIDEVPLDPAYLEMTQWVRQNTPEDALFHVADFERSFRVYARRAMIMGEDEWAMGIYTEGNPLTLRDLYDRLLAAQDDPAQLVQEVAALDGDYIVSPVDWPDLPLSVVYDNGAYRVYRMTAQS